MAPSQKVTVDIDAIPLAVALIGVDAQVAAANSRLVSMIGRDPSGQALLGFVDERDRVDLGHLLARPGGIGRIELRLCARAPMNVVVRMVQVDGGLRLAFFEPTADDGPLDDIATQAFEVLGQGIVIGDGTRILSATPSAARLFGRSVEELLEIGSLFSLFEPSEQERFAAIAADCARSGEPMPERFRTALVHPNGEVWPVDLWIKAAVRAGRTRTYTVIADARERASLEAELAHQATHDHLTGLPNRYLLLDRLETVLRRLQRANSIDMEAALYFIDLDDFKSVNDRFGHGAGDHVLRVTAARLLDTIRATDCAARIGGDEFIVLSEPGEGHEHEQLRQRLASALSEPIRLDPFGLDPMSCDPNPQDPRTHQAVEVHPRASIGLCRFSDGALDADRILGRADQDMYGIKAAHRVS